MTAGAGALGSALGLELLGGPAALVTIPATIAASMYASKKYNEAQQALLADKQKEYLAQSEAEHPYASTIGDVVHSTSMSSQSPLTSTSVLNG